MGINAAVLGIGNLLLSDEGVGVHAIRALREKYTFPEGLELIDGGTMGLDLLPFIEGKEKLLIVDAANFEAPPGTIRPLEGANIHRFFDKKFSVHQIGLPDMLFAAELKGMLPPTLCLVGIQPETLETGLEMSGAVRENFDSLIDAIIKKLREWGFEVKGAANVPGDTV